MVANEIELEAEKVLTGASKASVWVPWYFKRGALTLVTAPLFLFLCSLDHRSVNRDSNAVDWRCSERATRSLALSVAFIAVSFGWIPVILPPVLYYSLIKNLPGLWLRPDASGRARIISSFSIIVLLPLAAYLIFHGTVYGIGWVADHDPCAAFSSGVTGSKPPVNCP